jgi:Tol biopolymer transport system component
MFWLTGLGPILALVILAPAWSEPTKATDFHGDPLPAGAVARLGTVRPLSGQHPMTTLAVSPDGKTVASGSWDKTIRLWDISTGKEIRSLQGHHDRVNALAFSPEGKVLASASFDETVRLWDSATGKQVRTLQGHRHWVLSLAYSPDGKMLVSGSEDKTITLWDASLGSAGGGSAGGGQRIRSFGGDSGQVYGLAFSPDSKTLAVGNFGRSVGIWDLKTTKARFFFGHADVVFSVAFSPDGRVVASASRDKTLRLWDLESGEERRRFECPQGGVTAVAFSADGKTLAFGNEDQAVRLIEVSTGKERLCLRGHEGTISAVGFSADGTMLVSASGDSTALVWALAGASGTAKAQRLSSDQLEAAWLALGGVDAAAAYQAVCRLVADPRRAVSFLGQRLQPIPLVEEKYLTRRIAELDSRSFAVREQAARALEALHETVRPALKQALQGNLSLEARRRIERILMKTEKPFHPSSDLLRGLRALEVLERIGAGDARKTLTGISQGAESARLTQEARASLTRLAAKKPSQ